GLIIVAMNGAALLNLGAIGTAQVQEVKSKAAAASALYARMALARVENSFRGYLLSSDAFYLGRIDKHQGALMEQLETLRQIHAGDSERLALVDNAVTALNRYRQEVIEVGKTYASDPMTINRAVQMVGPNGVADSLMEPIENAIDAIIQAESEANAVFTERT